MKTTLAHKRCYKSPRCSKHPLQVWSALIRSALLCTHTPAAAHPELASLLTANAAAVSSDGNGSDPKQAFPDQAHPFLRL